MKKKVMYMIAIILFIISTVLFSKKIYKIKVIEKLSSTINKENEKSITTIDVTGIKLGTETEHEHIYKTMYDEEKHWEECIVCNEKRNEIVHSITTTWAEGSESCVFTNSYTKTCICGYSYTGHKHCVWDGKSYITLAENIGMIHMKKCIICGGGIQDKYYLGKYGVGEMYDPKFETQYKVENNLSEEHCYLQNGTKINCNNLGKCVVCAGTLNYVRHALIINDNNEIRCGMCQKEFGTCTNEITIDTSTTPSKYSFLTNIDLKNGATFNSAEGMRPYGQEWQINTPKIINQNSAKTQITLNTEVKAKTTYKAPIRTYFSIFIKIGGVNARLTIGDWFYYYPDGIDPVISSINNGDSSLTEWSKNKPITISGTENWTNTVKVKIIELEDEDNPIFEGGTTVNNGNYSISCTPDVEADLEGRTFKVIVTDECENSTEQEFTISKIDAVPPEVISNVEVGGDWAKEKSFTAVSSDHGIGNVQIAFNDVSDYALATKNGNEYTREYKLVGDVYQPTKARIFYKDELNNISSQEITIDKLDNTAPSITNAIIHNNKLTVEANDIKEGMGEGSGVTRYRFITSESKLENPEITIENSIEVLSSEEMIIPNIATVKYVYVVAEDLVGNVSDVYEYEVPQLILTSKVNINGASGKGAVELDWLSYDTADKYFVIYRKQEEKEEWKTIVSLDEKFNGNKYTDTLANDKKNPTITNINIEGKNQSNNIEITTASEDAGNKYSYYIEAYDTENTLLASSK